MMGFSKPISEQRRILDDLMAKAEKALKQSPRGTLVIETKATKDEWYVNIKDEKRLYLPKTEELSARQMAQASYAKDFLKAAGKVRRELEQIQALKGGRSASVMFHALAEPYEKLSDARKKLVAPYVLPDEEFAAAWEAVPYQGKPFDPDAPEIYTERGERVRSKSEKMIADKLYRMGLHYRYECPHVIRGIGTVYSDFTILDLREREEVLHEHFGLMDQPEYLKTALWKIDQYEKSGHFPGRQLLCSFESASHPIDLQSFEKMITDRFGL